MKLQFVFLLSLGLFLLLAGIFLGRYLPTSPMPTSTPVLLQPSPTAGQLISNPAYHYQFTLPASWHLATIGGPDEPSTFSTTYTKDNYRFVIEVFPTTFPTIQSYLADADHKSQTAWEGYPSIKVLSTKLTKINSYSVVQRQEDWLAAAFAKPVTSTYFLFNKTIYKLSLRYEGSGPDTSTWAQTDYAAILSSLKLND